MSPARCAKPRPAYEEMERKRQEKGDEPPANEWEDEPPDDEDVPF
jgi:hypothetical protein